MFKGFSYTTHHDLPLRPTPLLDAYIDDLRRRGKDGVPAFVTHESALFLPREEEMRASVRATTKRFAGKRLNYVIIIGIGGSNLGAKAVYDALRPPYTLGAAQAPTLLFLETLTGESLEGLLAWLLQEVKSEEEVLINLVSKSGNTVESIANFQLIYGALLKRYSGLLSRVVVTTDAGSPLWKEATTQGFDLLPIPAYVGGRFSVFSSVGLFPLFSAGIDVEEFCRGGRDMLECALAESREENVARRSAEELFAAIGAHCSVYNIFYFNPELESLGKWERQLFAESLGKEKDAAGVVVHAGITPVVSIGSTDLHSMVQLYLGGPRDKFTLFVRAKDEGNLRVPDSGACAKLVDGIRGKTSGQVMEAILGGVTEAYRVHGLPHSLARLPALSSYTLGLYMEWRMATVMYLAQLMKVNAFDQPNVEDYKKATRKILENRY